MSRHCILGSHYIFGQISSKALDAVLKTSPQTAKAHFSHETELRVPERKVVMQVNSRAEL